MKYLLFFIIIIQFVTNAQSIWDMDDIFILPVEGRTEINSFTVCKIDSQVIVNPFDMDFEEQGNWAGGVSENSAFKTDKFDGNGMINFGLSTENLIDYLSEFGVNDTLIQTFWFLDATENRNTSIVINAPIYSEILLLYPEYSKATSSGGYNEVSPGPMGFDLVAFGVPGDKFISMDDVSLIWRHNLPSYSTLLEETPYTVFYNNVELSRSYSGKYLANGEWDWVNGTLFINVGEHPAGVVEIQ